MSLFSLGIPQVQRRENQSPNKVIFYGRPTQVSSKVRVSYLFKLCGDHPLAQMMFQALTLDFKKDAFWRVVHT